MRCLQSSSTVLHVAGFPSVLVAEEYSIVCPHHVFFIQSSVSGHWKCFYVSAVVNNAAVNVKLKRSCPAKETSNRVKRQPTAGEKIFQATCLIREMYPKYIRTSNSIARKLKTLFKNGLKTWHFMVFQRRHTNGQHVYEKMLNIPNHQRNAIQNYSEIYHLTLVKMAIIETIDMCWWRCEVNVEYNVGKNANGTATMENIWKLLKKLELELPYDPTILHLDIYPKELKSGSWKYISTPMFITALPTIAMM